MTRPQNVQSTSRDVYHGLVVPHLESTQEARIAAYMERVRSATIGEIAHDLAMEKSTVSARQNDLRKRGVLEFSPERRKCRVSGVTCNVLRFAASQGSLFQ